MTSTVDVQGSNNRYARLTKRSHRARPELEVWFRHPAPPELAAYEAIFPQTKLVFGAAFDRS